MHRKNYQALNYVTTLKSLSHQTQLYQTVTLVLETSIYMMRNAVASILHDSSLDILHYGVHKFK